MKRRTLLGLGLLGAALPLLPACSKSGSARFQNTDLSSEGIIPAGKLVGADGQPRDLADFRGKAVLVYFGYTSCPDLCPSALRKFAAIQRNLRSKDAERLQVLFITIDPERDTPERADTYAKWFNPGFAGLSGSAEQIAAMARQFKVIYTKQAVDGNMGYVMDHSTSAYLLDPKGQLRLAIDEKTPIEPIISDLQQLLEQK